MAVYSLWDLESANLVYSFSSEEAALQEVRLSVEALGRDAVLSWGLTRYDADNRPHAIASGEELIKRACKIVA
ncbi:MAG: hypothetical protein ACRDJE_09245 [Dehalococcoidia bacterium]